MRFLHLVLLSGSISLLIAQPQKLNAPAHQPAAKQASAAVVKIMEGMVVSVDQAKQSFIIKLKGKEYAFLANNTTDIITAGGKKGFADLSAGIGARVTYTRDNKGNRVASSVSQEFAAAAKPVPATNRPVRAAQPVQSAVRNPNAQPAAAATQPAAPATAATAANQAATTANQAATTANQAATTANQAATTANQAATTANQAATTVNQAAVRTTQAQTTAAPSAIPVQQAPAAVKPIPAPAAVKPVPAPAEPAKK